MERVGHEGQFRYLKVWHVVEQVCAAWRAKMEQMCGKRWQSSHYKRELWATRIAQAWTGLLWTVMSSWFPEVFKSLIVSFNILHSFCQTITLKAQHKLHTGEWNSHGSCSHPTWCLVGWLGQKYRGDSNIHLDKTCEVFPNLKKLILWSKTHGFFSTFEELQICFYSYQEWASQINNP